MHAAVNLFAVVHQLLLVGFVGCQCAAGNYFDPGIGGCSLCAPGTAGDGATTSSCPPCSSGYFSSYSGASTCSACGVGYYSGSGSTTCSPCSPGMYSSSYASSSCTACGAGTYTPSSGYGSCVQCSGGSYNPYSQESSCTSCSGGYYSTAVGASSPSTCLPCLTVGTYSPIGSTACSFCPGGTYSMIAPVALCTDCPAGQYNPSAGSVTSADCNNICSPGTYCAGGCQACSSCYRGSYAVASGSSSCTLCQAGYYNPNIGSFLASDCVICPTGRYSYSGQAQCTTCAAGTYNDQQGRPTPCIPCAAGSYNPQMGSVSNASCLPCPLGTFSSNAGSVACTSCSAGFFADHLGTTQCSPCPRGTHNALVGQQSLSSCLLCPTGMQASTTGSPSCTPCPPGTYANVSGTSFCPQCNPGNYNQATNQSSCLPCSSGLYAPGTGSYSCSPCPSGTYAVAPSASASCLLCPAGTYSAVPGLANVSQCVNCPVGTFNPNVGNASRTACQRCPVNTYGNVTGMVQCIACMDLYVNPSEGSFLPSDCVMNCSFGNKTFSSSWSSTTLVLLNLDRRCANFTLSNLTLTNNATLNISLQELVDASLLPQGNPLAVSVVNCKVSSGAAIFVDAGQLGQVANSSSFYVLVQNLVSNNGGLLICGSFPSGSQVMLKALYASVSAVAAPTTFMGTSTMQPLLATYFASSSYVAGLLKCVVLVNVTMMNQSSLTIQSATLTASAPNSAATALILLAGTLSFSANSRLVIANTSVTALTSSSVTLYIGQPAELAFADSSQLVVFGCGLIPISQLTLSTVSDDATTFIGIMLNTTKFAFSRLSSFSILSSTSGRFVVSSDSVVVLDSQSAWQMSTCIFVSPLLFQSAFDVRGNVTLLNGSAMLVSDSKFSVLGSLNATPAVGQALVSAAIVSLGAVNCSDSGSFVGFSGNTLTQKQPYRQWQFCVRIGFAFVAGVLYVSENNCTLQQQQANQTAAFWSGNVTVLTQQLGLALDKCNRLNGAVVSAQAAGGFPTSTVRSAPLSVCGACDPGVDCFALLATTVVPNSVSCAKPRAAASLNFGSGSIFTQCSCYYPSRYGSSSGVLQATSLCLPITTVQLVRTDSTSVTKDDRTSSRSASHESSWSVSTSASEGSMTQLSSATLSRRSYSISNTGTTSNTSSSTPTRRTATSSKTSSTTSSLSAGSSSLSLSMMQSATQTSMHQTQSQTASVETRSGKNLSYSPSDSFLLPELLIQPKLVSAAVAGLATASVAVGLASAALAGPDAASDMQAIVLLSSAQCVVAQRVSGPESASQPAKSSQRTTPGVYQLVTPFALSDTALGALAGNVIVFGGIGVVQAVVILFVFIAKWKMPSGSSTPMRLLAASCFARLPGLLLLLVTALHQSTLFASLRLITGTDSSSTGSELLFGLVGILMCIAAPVSASLLMKRFPRRFVEYGYPHNSSMNILRWCPGFVSRQLLPTGVIHPQCARHFLSSLITRWREQALIFVLIPFISSLCVNVVAVLPASAPPWLCSSAIFVSAAAHLALAVVMLASNASRFPISCATSGVGFLVTVCLHVQIGSNYAGGIAATMSVQAGLSLARSFVSVLCLLLENRVSSSPTVSQKTVLWRVGDGGFDLASSTGELLMIDDTVDPHGSGAPCTALMYLETADFSSSGPLLEHDLEMDHFVDDDANKVPGIDVTSSSDFDAFALPPPLQEELMVAEDHRLNMFGEDAEAVLVGSLTASAGGGKEPCDNPLDKLNDVLQQVDFAVRHKLQV